MSQMPIIAMVGAGNVGVALATLFTDNGFEVVLGSRNPTWIRHKLKSINCNIPKSLLITNAKNAVKQADISLLTVPDKFISSVCESLAEHFKAQSIVAHCSGALDSRALVSAKHCSICSVHPLNTFPNLESALQVFSNVEHNTAVYYEGDNACFAIINDLFSRVGFHTTEISQQAKPLYHAACVFACNYLTVLMELSLQTAGAAGLDRDEFWQAVQPLIQATLNNIDDSGTAASLSGPIARGDSETIKRHLSQLSKVSKQLSSTYADLGLHALKLASENDELSANTHDELGSLLIDNVATKSD